MGYSKVVKANGDSTHLMCRLRSFHTNTSFVEDWFHILDSSAAPAIHDWPKLQLRAERNIEQLLTMFE